MELVFFFYFVYRDSIKQFKFLKSFILVKRQLLRHQSPITGLFPVLSCDTQIGSVRESIYCAAAVWSLYQAYRFISMHSHDINFLSHMLVFIIIIYFQANR